MITTSTSPFLHFDWGEDEPGMILQRRYGKWVSYQVDGEVVKSPVDIDELLPGVYRLSNSAPWQVTPYECLWQLSR